MSRSLPFRSAASRTSPFRKARRLNLEPLEYRSLLSVTVMESEPNDGKSSADDFAFEADGLAQLVGTSTSDGDKDYFTFVAPADATLNVDVQSPNDNVPGLQVENAAGDAIFQTDPNDGVNAGSVQLTAGSRYFVRLRAKDAQAAQYNAALSLTDGSGDPGGGDPGGGIPGGTPTSVDEIEPNDIKSQATAFSLAVGQSVALNGVSQNSNDKDFFKFTPTENSTLRAAVTSSNGNVASLEVEDPAGNDVLETEPHDGQNIAVGQVFAGTAYTVRLRSTNASPAAYQATLSLGAGTGGDPGGQPGGEPGVEPADLVVEAEPNDARSQATPFALGSDGEVQLSGTSASDDDKDFFRFTASESGVLRINVLAQNANLAALQIEDAGGNKLFETEPNDGVQSGAFHVAAGTSYSLRMRSKTNAPAEYLVELKMTREGDLTADTVIDRRDVIEAMYGWLHRGNGGHGADDNYDGRVSLDEILRVRNMQDAPGTEPASVLTETESNDSQSSANRFSLGTDGSIQLQGTSRSDRDNDYFTFTPATNGTLTINVASPNGNFAALEIEDAASVDVFETEPNDDVNSGTAQVVAGTQYFIRLRSKTETAADYEANLNLAAGEGNPGGDPSDPGNPPAEPANLVIETEPNSEKEEANPFALGSDNLAQLQGVSADSTGDEEDFFRFTAEKSGTLAANVLSRSGPHAQLQIEDADSNVVLETQPGNGVNTASGRVAAGTTYFVRLKGTFAYYNVGNHSEYLVNLSLTPDAASPAAPASVVAAAPSASQTPRSSRARGAASAPSIAATPRFRRSIDATPATSANGSSVRSVARRLSAASVDRFFARSATLAD
ncbi:MAG: hypothetical protein DCC68_04510 [Planctomycetota bacterium]|nr:MAG: hypothetical protein DCC68_04510 [Planctomycetota bacterium]